MPPAIEEWVSRIRAGDARAISRAATAIENRDAEAEQILQQLFPHTGKACRIGVTGAPGSGKSTLVDRLAALYRGEKRAVGIIATDPSSPFTGGAILGDRIRMQGHAADGGVFIRSMATRGFLGGLAQAAGNMALLLDGAGKEFIFLETVGVGQGEVEIARLADCTLVVLVPGMGDDIQNLKAGLMEIGDIFVLNKADREGAGRFAEQLLAMLQLAPERDGRRPPVVRTVATENKGLTELAECIEDFRRHGAASPDRRAREVMHWKRHLVQIVEQRLMEHVAGNVLGEAALDQMAAEIAERKKDPYTAAAELLKRAGLGARE